MVQLTPEQMAQLQQLPPEQRAQVEQKLAAQGGVGQAPQQPQECIFCKIVKGEIPAKIVAQNNDCIAFLDIQPKAPGHTVIVTKAHVGMGLELSETQKASVQILIDGISQKMMTNLKATGYMTINPNGVSCGQVMPHYAVHLIPTYGQSPDLPIMSILQPVKVPEFMMDSVFAALSGGAQAPAPQANPQPQQNQEGFYF